MACYFKQSINLCSFHHGFHSIVLRGCGHLLLNNCIFFVIYKGGSRKFVIPRVQGTTSHTHTHTHWHTHTHTHVSFNVCFRELWSIALFGGWKRQIWKKLLNPQKHFYTYLRWVFDFWENNALNGRSEHVLPNNFRHGKHLPPMTDGLLTLPAFSLYSQEHGCWQLQLWLDRGGHHNIPRAGRVWRKRSSEGSTSPFGL